MEPAVEPAVGTVFAVVVGIDDYSAVHRPPLLGCVNDADAARAWLAEAAPGRARILPLHQHRATVAAVTAAVRDHLGQAGPGDTALLWFSGHGTTLPPASPAELLVEATGVCQALLCADGPLPDKRLGALLDAVAAGGAHVAAVLDCCFAGGATREEAVRGRVDDAVERGGVRYAEPDPAWRARASAPGAVRDVAEAAPRPRHVLLAAGQEHEIVREWRFADGWHGLFSGVLLDALRRSPGASSRELLAAAGADMRRARGHQHPKLDPDEPGGLADRPLLGGTATAAAAHVLSYAAAGWEVDCGMVHGLQPGPGTEFAVRGEPSLVVRARSVGPRSTLAAPVGWAPERGRVYPVSLTALALPPAAVRIAAAPRRRRALLDALATAGPGGGPTPLVRAVAEETDAAGQSDGGSPGGRPALRVEQRADQAHVLLPDGSPAVPPLPWDGAEGHGSSAGAADVRRIVRCLVHLARWHQLRDLGNPCSPLAAAVRLEILPWGGDVPAAPEADGTFVFRYAGHAGAWRPPWVTLRIRNRSHRYLWCALVDLTDSYRGHTLLYPGHVIGPGGTGYARDGQPVELVLPPGRPPAPGAVVRDVLKLVVAGVAVNTVPFTFPAWDPAAEGPGVRDGAGAVDGVLRFHSSAHASAPAAGSRDAVPLAGPGPADWAALTYRLRTEVPG